jgi:DNA adenine methylase
VAASGRMKKRDSATEPRPFLKWAGGKRQLLADIRKRLPREFRTYHEPFLGGGALFFELGPAKAYLSDSNERLVRCYNGVKNSVDEVIERLSGYRKSRRLFLQMRKQDIDKRSDAEVAAWFIFLNRTGFNGLYRVNSRNQFNVPYGDNRSPVICNADNLRACQRALANADIRHEDFAKVLDRANEDDLVYFDPPYVPLSATSYFTAYTANGFSGDDQRRLRDLALKLKQRGVRVLISNSSAAAELYKTNDFSLRRVLASRQVNSKADRRGKIAELLIS